MQVRHTVVVVLDGSGRVRQIGGRHARTTTTTTTTTTTVRRVDARVLQVALELAGGDPSRLRFEADGSITVANKPRRPGVSFDGR